MRARFYRDDGDVKEYEIERAESSMYIEKPTPAWDLRVALRDADRARVVYKFVGIVDDKAIYLEEK